MDALISAAARALAAGDALGALQRVALRDDPPALALRGIAMAQLGDYVRARDLLRRAARGFGRHEALARARCVVAEAEVGVALRDLGRTPRALTAAAATLQARGDTANALQARLIAVRRLLLLGQLGDAGAALAALDVHDMPPALVAVAELAATELALRSLRTGPARAHLARAGAAAARAQVPALLAEVARGQAALDRPAARRMAADGAAHALRLEDVASLRASDALLVDACRRGVGAGGAWQPMAGRPLLFTLLSALARGWPGDVARVALIAEAFRIRRPDETHRARLRVEIGRLRTLVATLARIEATPTGFALHPREARKVILLLPPFDGDQASLVALLSDGAAWSTSALALALGASQRTVQRALVELESEGRVRAIGRARTRRWVAPSLAGFTTILLLPAALPTA